MVRCARGSRGGVVLSRSLGYWSLPLAAACLITQAAAFCPRASISQPTPLMLPQVMYGVRAQALLPLQSSLQEGASSMDDAAGSPLQSAWPRESSRDRSGMARRREAGAVDRHGYGASVLQVASVAVGTSSVVSSPLIAHAQSVAPQNYYDQMADVIPVKSIRGLWRIREFRNGQNLCVGRLSFQGFLYNKGTLQYTGCDSRTGKGNWLLKTIRIPDGNIGFSARWKVRYSDGQALIFRGDVLPGGNYAKAEACITSGEILQPIIGMAGSMTERRVGSFEADLLEIYDPPASEQRPVV